jgi:uncharacterized protein (DUF924 family)
LTTAAAAGELEAWESSPRRRLALILLLDQFPRSIHRGSAAAFATDPRALALSITGLQLGADAVLDPVERIFFYMPLQHAESLEVQEESVAAYRRLREEAEPELKGLFDGVCHAEQHRDIVGHPAAFTATPHYSANRRPTSAPGLPPAARASVSSALRSIAAVAAAALYDTCTQAWPCFFRLAQSALARCAVASPTCKRTTGLPWLRPAT